MALQQPRSAAHAACRWSVGTLAIAVLSTGVMSRAAEPFPSRDSLRAMQLAALACARENTAASCHQARALADPLLDHPRLPASCKDLLWTISQKAQPAASNSFERREAIAQPAGSLLSVCRSNEQQTAPKAAPAQPATPTFR